MRLGIVGTGDWARHIHGVTAAAHPDWDLVAVWGRSADKVDTAANHLGVRPCPDYADLLSRVDAVAFAVPPSVQAPLALEAARAGKHLLLEKPLALDPADADLLVRAVDALGLASAVFFTRLWTASTTSWLDSLVAMGGMECGHYSFIASLPTEQLIASPWRVQHGALWDIGPHALSVLERVLGPVVEVGAMAGVRDHTHLQLRHRSGATSSAVLTLTADELAAHNEFAFWGGSGRSGSPPELSPDTSLVAYAAALTSLAEQVRTGDRTGHADVRYGAHVTRVLRAAEESLVTGRMTAV